MKAHEVLADEASWCKGVTACDANHCRVEPTSPLATRFCILGAVFKANGTKWPPTQQNQKISDDLSKLNNALIAKGVNEPLTNWNDKPERTHAEVVALLKECDI